MVTTIPPIRRLCSKRKCKRPRMSNSAYCEEHHPTTRLYHLLVALLFIVVGMLLVFIVPGIIQQALLDSHRHGSDIPNYGMSTDTKAQR